VDAPTRVRFPVFGSEATVVVSDPRQLTEAQWIVQDQLDVVDKACSRFRCDSELTAVNAAAGRPVRVSPVFRHVLAVALRAAALTDGAVDPTVGAAVRVLGYDNDFASVPRTGPPVGAIARVAGWQRVRLAGNTVEVPAGVELDLGATAKAFAADGAARRVAAAVGCGVLIGLGGDVAVAGPPPQGGWVVGLADWHGASDDVAGAIRIERGGVATSSTTVRRWTRGSEQLHHVIDPATGRPATEVWRTVSVAAATCVDANTAATAAIVRGALAPEWLTRQGLPARLVGTDGTVVCVAGWPADGAT
jgi:thiamine biosynthesis lipoprotein